MAKIRGHFIFDSQPPVDGGVLKRGVRISVFAARRQKIGGGNEESSNFDP